MAQKRNSHAPKTQLRYADPEPAIITAMKFFLAGSWSREVSAMKIRAIKMGAIIAIKFMCVAFGLEKARFVHGQPRAAPFLLQE